RFGGGCRRSWKSVDAFGTCAGSGVAEFCIAGWSGIAAAELAATSKFQPGFFDARSAGDGRPSGVGRIRCAARAEFPGRAAGAREGAARRRVGCIWANDAAELRKLFFLAHCRRLL